MESAAMDNECGQSCNSSSGNTLISLFQEVRLQSKSITAANKFKSLTFRGVVLIMHHLLSQQSPSFLNMHSFSRSLFVCPDLIWSIVQLARFWLFLKLDTFLSSPVAIIGCQRACASRPGQR